MRFHTGKFQLHKLSSYFLVFGPYHFLFFSVVGLLSHGRGQDPLLALLFSVFTTGGMGLLHIVI